MSVQFELGPNQLEWCRQKYPAFAQLEEIQKRIARERQEASDLHRKAVRGGQ